LLDTARAGLEHEPTVQESLAERADLVSFSGDKLLGGPQAGIIVGRRSLIDILRRHPLTRAVRVDKITLAGLQATLQLYLEDRAWTEIPVWRMMTASVEDLTRRAERWGDTLRSRFPAVTVEIARGQSTVGGGSLPGETLPTLLLSLAGLSATALGQQLRLGRPAVVGRIENDHLLVDPRTVAEDEDEILLQALDTALSAILGDRSSPEQDMREKT
jgi:L-seryl-tRNA(Ser) seleniumtransferase